MRRAPDWQCSATLAAAAAATAALLLYTFSVHGSSSGASSLLLDGAAFAPAIVYGTPRSTEQAIPTRPAASASPLFSDSELAASPTNVPLIPSTMAASTTTASGTASTTRSPVLTAASTVTATVTTPAAISPTQSPLPDASTTTTTTTFPDLRSALLGSSLCSPHGNGSATSAAQFSPKLLALLSAYAAFHERSLRTIFQRDQAAHEGVPLHGLIDETSEESTLDGVTDDTSDESNLDGSPDDSGDESDLVNGLIDAESDPGLLISACRLFIGGIGDLLKGVVVSFALSMLSPSPRVFLLMCNVTIEIEEAWRPLLVDWSSAGRAWSAPLNRAAKTWPNGWTPSPFPADVPITVVDAAGSERAVLTRLPELLRPSGNRTLVTYMNVLQPSFFNASAWALALAPPRQPQQLLQNASNVTYINGTAFVVATNATAPSAPPQFQHHFRIAQWWSCPPPYPLFAAANAAAGADGTSSKTVVGAEGGNTTAGGAGTCTDTGVNGSAERGAIDDGGATLLPPEFSSLFGARAITTNASDGCDIPSVSSAAGAAAAATSASSPRNNLCASSSAHSIGPGCGGGNTNLLFQLLDVLVAPAPALIARIAHMRERFYSGEPSARYVISVHVRTGMDPVQRGQLYEPARDAGEGVPELAAYCAQLAAARLVEQFGPRREVLWFVASDDLSVRERFEGIAKRINAAAAATVNSSATPPRSVAAAPAYDAAASTVSPSAPSSSVSSAASPPSAVPSPSPPPLIRVAWLPSREIVHVDKARHYNTSVGGESSLREGFADAYAEHFLLSAAHAMVRSRSGFSESAQAWGRVPLAYELLSIAQHDQSSASSRSGNNNTSSSNSSSGGSSSGSQAAAEGLLEAAGGIGYCRDVSDVPMHSRPIWVGSARNHRRRGRRRRT